MEEKEQSFIINILLFYSNYAFENNEPTEKKEVNKLQHLEKWWGLPNSRSENWKMQKTHPAAILKYFQLKNFSLHWNMLHRSRQVAEIQVFGRPHFFPQNWRWCGIA